MDYRLQDLIDIPLFQALQDSLNELISFPSSIIDNDGNVLTATAWQDVCKRFHRADPTSEAECIQSDQYILDHLDGGPHTVTYRCPHGLVDCATPVIIGGLHLGNLFTGQFVLEPPDMGFFRQQAQKYGYDEGAYLEAVGRIPVWNSEQLEAYLSVMRRFTEMLGEAGLHRLRELESERLFRVVFEASALGIAITDMDGRHLDCNPALLELLGLTREEFLSHRTDDFTHPGDLDPDMTQWHELLAGKRKSYQREVRYLHRDGHTVWARLTVSLCDFGPGGQEAGLALVEDITERKRVEAERLQLEAQLRGSQRLESIGVLAGGIAHDFNNILAGILGFAELSLPAVESDTLLASNLLRIREAAQRAQELVRCILAFCRQMPREETAASLQAIVRDALGFARASLPATVDIRADLRGDELVVRADVTQLQQVILNICTNAEHAMRPDGGILAVTLAAETVGPARAQALGELPAGRYAVLSLSDTGCGMDGQTRERVFEPFFTTKPHGEGTGLGLSTCHGIVAGHGGAIEVESELGRGTTLRIYLPTVDEAAVDSPGPTAAPPTGEGRILLVDDEVALRTVGQRMLSRLGFETVVVDSAAEALDLLRADPKGFDLVLTDQTMSGMTGLALAGELRALVPAVPVIIMTGYSGDVTAEKVAELGVREVLAKPFTAQELAGAVSRALDGEAPSRPTS